MSQMLYQRDVYGKTLVELGHKREDIVVLDADLSSSTRTNFFAREFPKRFFNFGVAEQNMVATACGLASCGKTVFVSTFAMFATARAWDQIRNTLCYNNFNIKIVATHSGITVGPDGSSHQALEDIALMRSIPNMTVIVPCDAPETRPAVIAAAEHPGPVYVRLGRPKVKTIDNKKDFQLGKAYTLTEGKDLSIIACGIMVGIALEAVEILEKEGISCRLINMHTVKPLDEEIVLESACNTKGIIVCEEHSIIGGLGSAVSEIIAEKSPTFVYRLGVRDKFGQSGDPPDLLKEYNLTAEDIVKTSRNLLSR